MAMAQDLLILTMGDYIKESKPLPTARRHRGAKFRAVALPAAKVDLYGSFLESGLKKAEFARRIGIPKTHIERLFSMRHHSRLNQIEAGFAALGKRLHVEARSAARGLDSIASSSRRNANQSPPANNLESGAIVCV